MFLIFLLIRFWFLINIMDWRNKLSRKEGKLKKEAISKAIHDSLPSKTEEKSMYIHQPGL